MSHEVPLTPEQQLFADYNHDLVYKFLKDKKLPIDEFYDIVVFGYIKSVYRFLTNIDLQQHAFSTIAWKGMQGSLNDHVKSKKRQKNDFEFLNIYTELSEDPSIYENITAQNDMMTQLEINLLLHDLAKRVSKQQMDIVRMRSSGYTLQNIASHQNTSIKQIRKLLEEVRTVLMELCSE